jgi:hypothetical protein
VHRPKSTVQSALHDSVPPGPSQKSSQVHTSSAQKLLSMTFVSHSSSPSRTPFPQRPLGLAVGLGVGPPLADALGLATGYADAVAAADGLTVA